MLQVKRGALSYQISDNLNKLAQPKRKPNANVFSASSPSVRNAPGNTGASAKFNFI